MSKPLWSLPDLIDYGWWLSFWVIAAIVMSAGAIAIVLCRIPQREPLVLLSRSSKKVVR
jgi:hypothetical protein